MALPQAMNTVFLISWPVVVDSQYINGPWLKIPEIVFIVLDTRISVFVVLVASGIGIPMVLHLVVSGIHISMVLYQSASGIGIFRSYTWLFQVLGYL